jgi:hypothetical protein
LLLTAQINRANLTEPRENAMSIRPSVLIQALPVLAAFCACGGVLHAEPSEKPVLPAVLTAKPLKVAAGDTEERKLLKALYNERQTITAGHWMVFLAGTEATNDQLLGSARRFLQAGLELYDKPKDKLDLLKQMATLSDKLDTEIDMRASLYKTKLLRDLDRARAREFKIELDLQTLRIKKASEKR